MLVISRATASFVLRGLLVVHVTYAASPDTLLKNIWEMGVCQGLQAPLYLVGPDIQNFDIITVATIKKLAVTLGTIGGVVVEIMLDSGSSVSFIQQKLALVSKWWVYW